MKKVLHNGRVFDGEVKTSIVSYNLGLCPVEACVRLELAAGHLGHAPERLRPGDGEGQ